MNNKGFTLIELLATIIVLALVVSISSFAITSTMKKAKDKNYELLKKNIKDAAEIFYQECSQYVNDSTNSFCYNVAFDKIKLGDLVQRGYLKGNGKDSDGYSKLIDPNTDKSIADCLIEISISSDGVMSVINVGTDSNCPQLDGLK